MDPVLRGMDHHGKSFDKAELVGCDFLVKQSTSRSRASKSIKNPPPSFIRIFGKCPLFTHNYNCITFPHYHFFHPLFQPKVFIALLFSEIFTPNMSFSPFVYASHFGHSIQLIHSFSKPTSFFLDNSSNSVSKIYCNNYYKLLVVLSISLHLHHTFWFNSISSKPFVTFYFNKKNWIEKARAPVHEFWWRTSWEREREEKGIKIENKSREGEERDQLSPSFQTFILRQNTCWKKKCCVFRFIRKCSSRITPLVYVIWFEWGPIKLHFVVLHSMIMMMEGGSRREEDCVFWMIVFQVSLFSPFQFSLSQTGHIK